MSDGYLSRLEAAMAYEDQVRAAAQELFVCGPEEASAIATRYLDRIFDAQRDQQKCADVMAREILRQLLPKPAEVIQAAEGGAK